MTPLTDAELEQRRQAGRSHGVYAIARRGAAALTLEEDRTLAEIREAIEDRKGTVAAIREQAALAILLSRLLSQHIAKQVKGGRQVTDMAAIKALGSYINGAVRALKTLHALYGQAAGPLDVAKLVEAAMAEVPDDPE